jgi:tetratricopeptide (TPR) repeat protein
MRRIFWLMAAALVCPAAPQAQEHQHEHVLTEQEVGSVHFATTCTEGMTAGEANRFEDRFNRTVALLHSFQYEQTGVAFTAIAEKHPNCAMAWWGIAMSYYHGLWGNSQLDLGRTALEKARLIAATNAATSQREKEYIEALGEIYVQDSGDITAHAQGFEKKMGQLAATNPTDSEAAIFHALALKFSASRTDKTFANERKCGEILEPIFKEQPYHPGVAHYIIHCYDNPALAESGLGAARLYAKIAPASAHANHMPSHIFTRVGAWPDSISSNLRSAKIAEADEGVSKSGEARDQRLHAMDYLEYAYLQSGRLKLAAGVIAEMNGLKPVEGLTLTGDYALAAIPARHAIELGNWEEASSLRARDEGVPWAQAITWEAIGEGSARSGKHERAARAEKKLAELRDLSEKRSPYWSKQIEVQRREVAAWIATANGKTEEALTTMRSAADLEESMDKDAVTPGATTPAREMLAQLLLLGKQPQAAQKEYEAVLRLAPKRFNAVYGAAGAAESAGDTMAANSYFRQLMEIAPDAERPEFAIARKKVSAVAAVKP